jgi:hypothetical protein
MVNPKSAEPTTLIADLTPPSTPSPTTAPASQVTPLNCFLGGLVAGTIAVFFYHSAEVIAGIFARTQISSENFLVIRMSTAIRTLVIGMFSLGAGVFGMAAIGLTGLGFQTLFKKAPAGDESVR